MGFYGSGKTFGLESLFDYLQSSLAEFKELLTKAYVLQAPF